jgi:plastocyanin
MRLQRVASIFFMAVFAACGGGDGGGGGGGNNPVKVIAKAASSGDNQTGIVAAALANSFCVIATEDAAAKSGVAVSWSTPNGGSMSAVQTSTAADGTACSKLTLGHTSGAQTAVATASGFTGSPVTFNATANADAATDLQKNGGDLQSGNINTQITDPVSVKAVDQFGNGVSNVAIDWLVTSGAATTVPLLGNTDGNGISNSTVTVGGTAGAIVITATATGLGLSGSPQTFNLTGVNPPPPPTAITINVQNFVFSPKVDTVAAGGTVTWDWVAAGHSVTSTGPTSFISDPAGIVAATPHSYGPITFNTPGTYFYYCLAHGGPGNPPTGMSGTIVVQ